MINNKINEKKWFVMVVPALRRLYAPEYMIKASLKRGEIPSTEEAYRTAFAVAWASILETFLIALISMADTVMVSGMGENAIAAVGLATQPRFIVQTLIFSLNIAITSIAARRRGENNQEGALSCLKQGLVLSMGLSLVLSVVAIAFRRPLLVFTGAQGEALALAEEYFFILLLGIPFNNLSLTISSAQRGIGFTKASMYINMLSNCVNLVFNFLLINGRLGFPRLGVRGAAIATVIGWVAGLLLAVISVGHRDRFLYIFTRGGWRPQKDNLKSMYQVASGAFIEQICMRVGFLAYTKVVAGLGMLVYAANQILINLLSLSFSFGEGFGIAATSLVGQNLGAKRPDLSIVYGKTCQRMSFISSSAVFLLFAFAGRYMLLMFTSNEQVLAICTPILYIMSVIIFGQASQMILMGSLRGAGDTKYTAIISMISITILRPTIAYVMAYVAGWGLMGAWMGFLTDQMLRWFLTMRRFSSGKWMNIKL